MYGWKDAALDFIVGLAAVALFFGGVYVWGMYADVMLIVAKYTFIAAATAFVSWFVGVHITRKAFKMKPFAERSIVEFGGQKFRKVSRPAQVGDLVIVEEESK